MMALTTIKTVAKVVGIIADTAAVVSVLGSFTKLGLDWRVAKRSKLELNEPISFEPNVDTNVAEMDE